VLIHVIRILNNRLASLIRKIKKNEKKRKKEEEGRIRT
jgi:hypothetical protein